MEFEAKLKDLESLIRQLEKGDQPLEKSLELYEKGVSMVKVAEKRLTEMQGKIEQLMADGTQKAL
ncbi:MAG: exodeoxyribonuclease VII small subunit [Deltaproteobacteria bacterium]|nr:exodeoxyribonuclease VII small subunit [Deltaproteobacteria bacterium]